MALPLGSLDVRNFSKIGEISISPPFVSNFEFFHFWGLIQMLQIEPCSWSRIAQIALPCGWSHVKRSAKLSAAQLQYQSLHLSRAFKRRSSLNGMPVSVFVCVLCLSTNTRMTPQHLWNEQVCESILQFMHHLSILKLFCLHSLSKKFCRGKKLMKR